MMKILFVYLREHVRDICLYVGFMGIFAVIFYLYNIRTDAVKYAFLLSAVWLLLYAAAEFIRYVRKLAALREAEKRLPEVSGAFPRARTQIEADYQRMLENICGQMNETVSQERISYQEMMDYYGMWIHQIKTPISAMRLLIQSGRERGNTSGGGYEKELSMELFKIEQYVEMVLTYLRVGDMSADFTLEMYPLDNIVRQAVRKYSRMFILRGIRLDFKEMNESVLTDEKWLVFVVEQLLSNAIKYTKSGSVSVYMEEDGTYKDDADERKRHALVIEDTGIGIHSDDLPRVFEKGFTGYNGRTDKKSSGIGLYLCKCIMDKLRHSIWIESEAGKGTKVYLGLGRREIHPE